MSLAEYRRLIRCIDLTSLNEDDTPETINLLCKKASTPLGNVAAVCVYPQFVAQAWLHLMDTPTKIATVANFPEGNLPFDSVSEQIHQAITDGATEIDVVVPYHFAKTGEYQKITDFITHCKLLCEQPVLLKAILETGELDATQIRKTSEATIAAGVDFLKTSTGKTPVGATPDAARIMLAAIATSAKPIGFKAAGGIRYVEQAKIYYALVKEVLGDAACQPTHFRLGTSVLLDRIIETVKLEAGKIRG